MSYSTIEWTDFTWNPLRGCSCVSPGCHNCYAARMAARFAGPGEPFEGFARITSAGPQWTGKVELVEDQLLKPLTMVKPRRIFVNSMGDLFHEDLPQAGLDRICQVMAAAPWHTFQVLTKRGGIMAEMLSGPMRFAAECKHIWWGTSVENRKALQRVDLLRGCPARNRFLSIEPLLEDLGTINLDGIGWVIVGGESGPRARPMEANWVRSLRRQCVKAKIPFFFKQWGGTRKKETGNVLDGHRYRGFPRFAASRVPPRAERKALIDAFMKAQARQQLVQLSA